MHAHDGVSSVLFVHGAASGPWVFDGWLDRFAGARIQAVDLHEGLDVARASMCDYAERVERGVEVLPRPVAVCAWSMGGLVAMMAAQRVELDCLVLLEPSPPAEIQGTDVDVELVHGTFDGEASYGTFPVGVRSRLESMLARAERKRGISVARLVGPSLVISGCEFAMERGSLVAERYGCDELTFPELDHWGLVLDTAVPDVVARHLAL
jgi:pimeloyl-ACP methyl ester carboxylesterase